MLQLYYHFIRNSLLLAHDDLIGANIGVDWYLRQYYQDRSAEDDGLITHLPMVYIEFMPLTWRTLPMNIQRAVMTFRLHILTGTVHGDDRNFVLPQPTSDTNSNHLLIAEDCFRAIMNKRAMLSMVPDHLGDRYSISGQDVVIMESIVRTGSPVTATQMDDMILTIQEYQCVVTDYSAHPGYQKTTVPTDLDIKCDIVADLQEPLFLVEISMDNDHPLSEYQICTGTPAQFSSLITGGFGTILYQWQRLVGLVWTDEPSATAAIYITPNLTGPEGTQYTFRLKATRDGITHYSDPLTVGLQRQPQAFAAGDPATITTEGVSILTGEAIGGIGGFLFQWQHLTAGVWTDIPEAWDTTYLVIGSQWGVGTHQYRMIASQDVGCSATSPTVTITINTP